jgi:hypothetical protein
MDMVHHQDVTVELSTHLLAAQRGIESLRTQLWNSDSTIRGYQGMVEGQASDLYTSDMDTWSTASMIQGSVKEPPVDATIQGYQGMVEGQASDLYTSDMDT